MRAVLLLLLFGYVYGQDPCAEDGCDDDGWCGGDCPDDCVAVGSDGMCFISTGGSFSTTEDCDDDEDAHNYEIDYVGKSTQFKLYDPCDSKFIKIKMEDITELDSEGGKTGNKETSFASSDWDWDNPNGVYVSYNGANAILNRFVATSLTKMDATFTLETIFFREDAIVTLDNGTNITVNRNNLKFNVEIEDWQYEEEGNTVELCIGIMTNKAGDIDNDPDTETYYLDGFEIDNDNFATCDGNDDVNVTLTQGGNGNNHLDLCYKFEYCDSGDVANITYDPIIKYIGSSQDIQNTDSPQNSDPHQNTASVAHYPYFCAVLIAFISSVF